ncbi:MAG: hypothetical protein ACRC8S_20905 [Fimbriiglobus sp.]
MIVQVEEKAQNWRALAIYNDGTEGLLFLGRSSTQVRSGYEDSFSELLTEDERESVSRISLQQWQGAPDAGKWTDKGELRNPLTKAREKASKLAMVA